MKLIRDEELLNYIKNHDYELVSRMGCVDRGMFTDGIEHAINVQEAVEVVEVVHGRWNRVEADLGGGIKTHRFACSECGFLKNTLIGNYCPNCGARMDGAEDGK